MSAPDDHFTAGPDCRVNASGSGRVGGAGGCPTIRAGIVSPAGVRRRWRPSSAPDDHFTAGPDCRVTVSGSGRVGGAGGCPTIRAGIVSPAGVQIAVAIAIRPRRSFHCRSRLPCDRLGQRARWWCWWLSNCPCWDCISRRCSKSRLLSLRPRRSFHCRSRLPCDRLGQRARWWCWWLSNCPCWDCISRRCSKTPLPSYPPQTIISLPVQTAV